MGLRAKSSTLFHSLSGKTLPEPAGVGLYAPIVLVRWKENEPIIVGMGCTFDYPILPSQEAILVNVLDCWQLSIGDLLGSFLHSLECLTAQY